MPYLVEYQGCHYLRPISSSTGRDGYVFDHTRSRGHRFATRRSAQCYMKRMANKHGWDSTAIAQFQVIKVES